MSKNYLSLWIRLAFALAAIASPAALEAGAWTLSPGRVWGKVTFFQQHAEEWYISNAEFVGVEHKAGTRRPYRFNGKYDSKAVFIEGFVGVTERLDLGIQVPYFDQVFEDDATFGNPPSASGFSDMRFFVKWRALQAPAIVTFKPGAKVPTGEFRNEDGLIPVGEGQWDFDFFLQVGRSFWPLALYANVDVGYRMRTENKEILRDPGDEWVINGEIGYNPTARLMLATKLEMLRGRAGSSFGFESSSLIKRITYFAPTAALALPHDTTLEVAVRYSLDGRNFPAGHQVAVGLSTAFDLWNR